MPGPLLLYPRAEGRPKSLRFSPGVRIFSPFMSRTALITGATGFVGGHLAEYLVRQGWRVRALVRPTSDTARLRALGAELTSGDLHAADALRAAASGADTVFHLAGATTAPSEAAFHRSNTEGTRNVVTGVLRAGERPRRLVYASSYAACGPAVQGRPRRMDETPAPITAYGRSKLAGEAEVLAATGEGVEVVVLRVPAVYGPGDRASFLPLFKLVKRRLAPLPGGAPRRAQLVYVDDLVRALARAADAAPGTYAVAGLPAHPFPELLRGIGEALGTKPLRIAIPPALFRAAGTVAGRWGEVLGGAGVFNREKAEEVLAEAWECDLSGSEALLPPDEAMPLGRGLAETARWYRTQGWL
jgi:nucleoside-diphosphate-sugar epimerase